MKRRKRKLSNSRKRKGESLALPANRIMTGDIGLEKIKTK